jgi:tRNA(adenine34) deaminase
MDIERLEYFMRQALAEAELAFEEGEVPIGAVVVKDDRIVGRGRNQMERLGDPTAHAEILAIGAAAEHFDSWRLIGATLVSTIEPCVMCAGAAVHARVRQIVYGARDPKFGGCDSIFQIPTDWRLNHRVDLVAGILAEQSSALMREFFVKQRMRESKRF